MPNNNKILPYLPRMLAILRKEIKKWEVPAVGKFASGLNVPFKILIATVLSLRTKDKVTEQASRRLFELADNPFGMLDLSIPAIEKAIYPVGFYHTKARNIRQICEILIQRHGGNVPGDLDTLLTFPGVGRKTANLVLTVGFKKPGICVDTHVHRICNRWGLVHTKSPDETEMVLRKILPQRYWITFNDILVTYGQNLCVPVSPHCSRCRINSLCSKKNVKSSR